MKRELSVAEYTCKYCKKSFKRERTLIAHMCEPKKRFQEKDEVGVRLGFQAYDYFYKYTQDSTKTKTHEDFMKSPYYNAFVKFGRYCVDINVINFPRFAQWVIHNNKKIDYWTKDSVYDEYLIDLIYKENPVDALERAIKYSIKWGEENDADPKDIVRHGNTNSICHLIITGHISPWVLYTSESGQRFFTKLTTDQQQIIWSYIDPDRWSKTFKKYSEEKDFLASMLETAGW
jgi:hypothetical protein